MTNEERRIVNVESRNSTTAQNNSALEFSNGYTSRMQHLCSTVTEKERKDFERPALSFSIECILGSGVIGGERVLSDESNQGYSADRNGVRNDSDMFESFSAQYDCGKCRTLSKNGFITTKPGLTSYPKFDWLQCTRYKPPNVLHAKRKKTNLTSRSSRQPRIPFTPFQQATLENQFINNHYLSSQLLNELLTILKLSKQRIKIWYQNRRARDRREEQVKERKEETKGQVLPSPSETENI